MATNNLFTFNSETHKFLTKMSLFFIAYMCILLTPIKPGTPDAQSDYIYATVDVFLNATQMKNGVVSIGASHLAFGLDGPHIEQNYFPFQNTGIHGGLGGQFNLEQLRQIDSTNFILFSPVYEWLRDKNYAGNALSELAIVYPPARRVLFNSPISRITFNAKVMKWWITPKQNTQNAEGWWDRRAFNRTGTLEPKWILPNDYVPNPPTPIDVTSCDCRWMREYFHKRSGVLLPPPIRSECYDPLLDAMWEACAKQIGIPLLLPQHALTYPDSIFLDNSYHLDTIGRSRYTKAVIHALTQHKTNLN